MSLVDGNNKILIMAGGTGGHVFPALSIAEYLLEHGMQVEWLGTRNGLEATVIGNSGIPLHFISIAGLRGKSLLKKILAPFVIVIAIMQSVRKLIQIRPSCVLGMGGFVTGPGGVAAWLLRKRLLVHEQNAIAGMTNQLLYPLASVVMEAFPGAFERKKSITRNPLLKACIRGNKAVVTGNPVRSGIFNNQVPAFSGPNGRKPRVLVIGGSLGAVAINRVIPAMLALMPEQERPEILHQCGRNNEAATRALYMQGDIAPSDSIRIEPFIDDMAQAYAWADLVICRAGALTVSEIAAAGRGSILIPYPHAVDDHQTENAAFLARLGAAVVIQEKDLTAETLLQSVSAFCNDSQALQQAAVAATAAGRPDATETAGRYCMEACYV